MATKNGNGQADNEAAELVRRLFPDLADHIVVRHFPDAECSCLKWQCGVLEEATGHYNHGVARDDTFHLFYFASTRAALVEQLEHDYPHAQ